jgi:hypothetical protein
MIELLYNCIFLEHKEYIIIILYLYMTVEKLFPISCQNSSLHQNLKILW